jgi:hypothetical protein
MGILEETKVTQVINRMENTRAFLNEINENDKRFKEEINQMITKIAEFEKELGSIKEQLSIENLGVKKHS